MSSSPTRDDKEKSLFTKPIVFGTRIAIRYPVQVLVLAITLGLISIFFTVTDMKFKTSRQDLINPKSEFNQNWINYIEDFGDRDDLVVVVEGPSQEVILPVLDELSKKIKEYPKLFTSVLYEIDTTPLMRKGLHFVESDQDLKNIQQFVAEGQRIVSGHWEYLGLENYLGGLGKKLQGARQQAFSTQNDEFIENEAKQLLFLSRSLLDVTSPQPRFNVSPFPPIREMGTLKREYFIADQGRLGVVLLKIRESKEGSFTYGTKSIRKLREIIDECERRHPETQIGLTGLTVMENDEMRSSQVGSAEASILSLIGVAIVFMAAFGGFIHPAIAISALGIGIAWTMGYIVWGIGHLNILSMSFGVILIGMGIDFGIHYISKYLELRRIGIGVDDAMLRTARDVGPGIWAGAMTTAAAFAMVGLSEFTGVAELGIISAGGILLCCVAALLTIPAIIQLVDGGRSERTFSVPKTVIFLGVLLTVYLATGLPKVWYDHNLLNMQPEHLESVELEKKLLQKWDKGAWFALSLADTKEELLERKKEFEKDPTLRVDEIVSRFPETSQEKQAIIQQILQLSSHLPEAPDMIPVADRNRLGIVLSGIMEQVESLRTDVLDPREQQEILWNFGQSRDSLRRMTDQEYQQRVGQFQQLLAGEMLGRLHLIHFAANPEPPELSDLPESLVSRYVGQKSGKFLMRIYSTTEIWSMEHLKVFIDKVKKVDPNITGNPIQTYEASLQIQRSYQISAVYALIAALLLVYLDFRSIKYVFLAIVPLIFGSIQCYGLLGLLDIPLNPANCIVLPLILGIGIDDGIHLVHNYRLQQSNGTGRYQMPDSLAMSIVITTLTTAIGFGSLMIADHRGLQSLGRVLVIGISCCTFSSLIIMPAILLCLPGRNKETVSEKQRGHEMKTALNSDRKSVLNPSVEPMPGRNAGMAFPPAYQAFRRSPEREQYWDGTPKRSFEGY